MEGSTSAFWKWPKDQFKVLAIKIEIIKIQIMWMRWLKVQPNITEVFELVLNLSRIRTENKKRGTKTELLLKSFLLKSSI